MAAESGGGEVADSSHDTGQVELEVVPHKGHVFLQDSTLLLLLSSSML